MSTESKYCKEVQKTVDQICPIMAGVEPEVQGAVLADLVATYLASHIGPNRKETRKQVLDLLVETVNRLVPSLDEAVAKMKRSAH